jgi:S1-C subfamily serine protease
MRPQPSSPGGPTPAPPGAGFSPPTPSPNPADGQRSNPPSARQILGIESEPVVDSTGVRGMRITVITPGSVAGKAGLQVGDVIRSINNYLTQQYGNLEWIFVNAAPNNSLKMNVLMAGDRKEHAFKVQIR